MLKGRANYLCTRRLHKAMQQSGNLFTSSEAGELQRIYEWSKETTDGSLSDFDIEPDMKVWAQVCSERGLCSPKICGHPSDFAKDHGVCFFQRARNRILSSDVLVLNHTLFFTLLGGVDEDIAGGILFKNDFRDFRRGAPDGTRGVAAHRPERVERAGALRTEPAVESAHGKGTARHVAQGRRGEAGGGHPGEVGQVFRKRRGSLRGNPGIGAKAAFTAATKLGGPGENGRNSHPPARNW